MQNVVEALAKSRLSNLVRDLHLELDDRDECTVTIKLGKSGRDGIAVYRVGYRDAMTMPRETMAYRLIDVMKTALETARRAKAEAASAAPEPEPVVHPHPKKHGGDGGPKAA